MPRFYFDLRNGHEFIRDDEGVDARDHRHAMSEAQAVLSQMKDDGELEPVGTWTLVIRSEGGAMIGTVAIA